MIASLQKINIIAARQYQEKILDILQSRGLAHIIKKTKSPSCAKASADKQESKIASEIEDLNYKLSNIKFALKFLEDSVEQKQSFKDKLSFEKKSLTYAHIKQKTDRLNIEKITNIIAEIEKNIAQGTNKLAEIKTITKELEPWMNLKEMPEETDYTKTITGFISLNKYLQFIKELEGQAKELSVETFYQGIKNVYLQITYLKKYEEQIKETANQYKLQIQTPEAEGLPASEIKKLKKEQDRISNNLEKWRLYIKKFEAYTEPLKMAEDYLTWQLTKIEAKKRIIKTNFFIIIKAWLKRDDLCLLKNDLKEISQEIFISKIKTKKGEKPPVIIKNNNFIQPFETVTGIYGMPRYNEIDPTPYLAPFFIIFFALCLTDAGYGLVMAIGTFLAIKLLKIPREKQGLFRLLGYGGIVTFIIGALFGGWFGIDVAALSPGPIKNFIESVKIIDPMQDTVLFMVIAFSLGLLQIWFSQIVKAISASRNKLKGNMISGLTWAAFLAMGILWLISSFLHFEILTKISLYIMLLTMIGLVVTESRNTKNIFIKPIVGIIAIIQGLIGFMSDTLSYSRLMALGLATGIIAFIINTIAVIFRDLIPYAGWIIWVLILLGGHIFNLGINALGSFIHSGRLQFVEFFPKFMEGGGERFAPFKRESKYFNVSG